MNVLLRLTAIAIVLAGSPLFAQTPERGDRRPERGDRMETRRDQSSGNREKFSQRIREFVQAGKLTREEAGELLRLAFPEVPRPRGRGRTFEVKDPADFIKPQEKAIFSGPQSGEKISNFMIQGMNGDYAEKDFDPIAEAKDKPLLLLFQDDSGVGFRGLAGWSQVLPVIREQESTDRAEVVRTAIPGLDDTDGATGVSTMPWESRPDPFAVGWQEAQQDPATGREELRAWEDWTSTLSAESAAAPVWTDAPSGRSFDFKRWLPGPTDQDTVELAAVDAEGPMTTPDPEEKAAPVVPPVIDLRLPRSTTPFPDFAPWPDAPWRTTSSGTDRIDA